MVGELVADGLVAETTVVVMSDFVNPRNIPQPEQEIYPGPLARGNLVFDIETGPQSYEKILTLVAPFEPPPKPGEFDPSQVKLGNATKPETVAKKIEEARLAHAEYAANYDFQVQEAKQKWINDLVDRAPLDAMIGQVLAIGYRDVRGHVLIDAHYREEPQSEESRLQRFWSRFVDCVNAGYSLIGHNSKGFDLPFMIRRSWILGVDVPSKVMDGRYFSRSFIDTREVWLCGGSWQSTGSSLDAIARAMGVGAKTEGMTGDMFWRLWQSGESDKRRAALDYLANDVNVTAAVAERMGLM